jgi:hypothetical protein
MVMNFSHAMSEPLGENASEELSESTGENVSSYQSEPQTGESQI